MIEQGVCPHGRGQAQTAIQQAIPKLGRQVLVAAVAHEIHGVHLAQNRIDRQLAGRTANRVYRAAADAGTRVLARHVGLSDDWGIRFSDEEWACHPLTADTYVDWIAGGLAQTGGTVCPIMLHLSDLGLTHPKESLVFSFTRRLLTSLGKHGLTMVTPSPKMT